VWPGTFRFRRQHAQRSSRSWSASGTTAPTSPGAQAAEPPAFDPGRRLTWNGWANLRAMVEAVPRRLRERDANLARAVIASDDHVDELYTRIYGELIRLMLADPLCIERASHSSWSSRTGNASRPGHQHLRRGAFILEGRNVKHSYLRTATDAHHPAARRRSRHPRRRGAASPREGFTVAAVATARRP